MPQQVLSNVENNFTKGLITEFTGLNFPENAATDTQNCTYTLIGDVTRREGIDYEVGSVGSVLQNRSLKALSEYKWNNAGGDGLTQVMVEQIDSTLNFYLSSSATSLSPLTNQKLATTISINAFAAAGVTFDATKECQFSDGNGYLFVYHPSCDPFYCTYNAGVVTGTPIMVNIRDFTGIPETIGTTVRPATASVTGSHIYNLLNQGWVKGSPWQATSGSVVVATPGVATFTVASSLTISTGDVVLFTNTVDGFPGGTFQPAGSYIMTATVSSYVGTTLTVNITSVSTIWTGVTWANWFLSPQSIGYLNTFVSAVGVYPSNSDVWWYFKNSSGVFDPATTIANVTLSSGNAPQGHIILNAFNQQRSLLSGQAALSNVSTSARPTNGAWFQGRVWYTGINAQQPSTTTSAYYNWSENIYFSKIVTSTNDFGSCYQTNDPTSANLFNLLPSDGGVIQVQGCGAIYKLFPLQNAMLIFAANGVWYLTGSTGIGFTANDYTIVKLSSVRSISSTSFVDVLGLPMFWNEEGIYKVEPAKQGSQLLNNPLHVNPLEVNPITVGTILSFYNNIPIQSKKYVRGAYHPIDYVVQWIYRSTPETNVTDRYQFDSILNFNTFNKAFFPYTIAAKNPYIHSVRYVESPGGLNAAEPAFKYFSSQLVGGAYTYFFADEHDTSYVDWNTFDGVGVNYVSYFITGYKLHGQGQRRFQSPYIYLYSRLGQPVSYIIQTNWDYALTASSGRWSVAQKTNINSPNFGMTFKRHRIRGNGIVLQIKVSSVDGQAFDVMGWSAYEQQNQGV